MCFYENLRNKGIFVVVAETRLQHLIITAFCFVIRSMFVFIEILTLSETFEMEQREGYEPL